MSLREIEGVKVAVKGNGWEEGMDSQSPTDDFVPSDEVATSLPGYRTGEQCTLLVIFVSLLVCRRALPVQQSRTQQGLDTANVDSCITLKCPVRSCHFDTKPHLPWARCSAFDLPSSESMSRNSANNFTAGSERISRDFINDIVKVVRNCSLVLGMPL